MADNRVVVFSQVKCGYCDMAKAVLEKEKIEYKLVELDKPQQYSDIDMPGLVREMINRTHCSTVPQIFIK